MKRAKHNENRENDMFFTATETNLTHPAILGKTRKDYFDFNSKVKTFSPSVTTVADNPDFS